MTDTTEQKRSPLTLGRSMWAIRPDALPRIMEAHRAGAPTLSDGLAERLAATVPEPRLIQAPQAARGRSSARAGGAVAVIPLTGVVTPRGSFLSMLFGGGGGLLDFQEQFREAMGNPDVGAILLDVDSPGGLVDLVPETATMIREARGTKPIVAISNTLAASAAYWIGSQADEFVVTPSGSLGSIGVYMAHEDLSGALEQRGINVTYISAGKYKIEGNPTEPLSEEAQAAWQEEVDDLYGMFVDAVAEGRGATAEQVRDGYGEGRVLLANRAVQAGLADRVATYEDVVRGLLAGEAPATPATAAALFTPEALRAAMGLPVRAQGETDAAYLGRALAELATPPAGDEDDDEQAPPPNDPTHVPDETPPVQPPADPAEPDTGPDAPDEDAQAEAALLFG